MDLEDFNLQARLEFFNDTRQSFGGTALLLQGGATFGIVHLGVVKALNEAGVLPRVICGSSVGALIAALVCIHTDEELPSVFETGGVDLKAFAKKGAKGNVARKITRFLKHGYFLDVKVLEDCVRSNVGDITFEEAYLRTNKILNITVGSTRKNETPRILNYLTAPNVLIWSAACTSSHTIGLYETVDLLAKDAKGNIVHWCPTRVDWSDVGTENAELRLSELFNVNHFILSQANPYFAPVLGRGEGVIGKLAGLALYEFRYRLEMLRNLGLLPRVVSSIVLDERFKGHVAISPEISASDFETLFSSPTYASLEYWVKKGEQSSWPFISAIKNRMAIELALDDAIAHTKSLADVVVKGSPMKDLRLKRKSII